MSDDAIGVEGFLDFLKKSAPNTSSTQAPQSSSKAQAARDYPDLNPFLDLVNSIDRVDPNTFYLEGDALSDQYRRFAFNNCDDIDAECTKLYVKSLPYTIVKDLKATLFEPLVNLFKNVVAGSVINMNAVRTALEFLGKNTHIAFKHSANSVPTYSGHTLPKFIPVQLSQHVNGGHYMLTTPYSDSLAYLCVFEAVERISDINYAVATTVLNEDERKQIFELVRAYWDITIYFTRLHHNTSIGYYRAMFKVGELKGMPIPELTIAMREAIVAGKDIPIKWGDIAKVCSKWKLATLTTA